MKTIGVILAGCGHQDGAEIHEAVYTLLALSMAGVKTVVMAPNANQHHVLNHITGKEQQSTRNIMEEAARISRGNIVDIETVDPNTLDAVIMPGGFGAAKNLCNLAFAGADAKVIPSVANLLTAINKQGKPIGAICISPVIISLIFGKKGVKVTIGNSPDAAATIALTGGEHIEKPVTDIYHDEHLNIVSTPAFMYGNATYQQVYTGISKLVQKVVDLA